MNDRTIPWAGTSARWFERGLACAILIGVIAFGVGSAIALAGTDWRDTATL